MANKTDESFATTSRILFGKPLPQLDRYADWLLSRIAPIRSVPSAIGKGSAAIPDYSFFGYIPKSRVVAIEHVEEAAQKKITAPEGSASLASLLPDIRKIAYFVPTFVEGSNLNVTESACYLDCLNVKKSFDPFYAKNSAYMFQNFRVEAVFGSYYIIDCSFLIHCYNCINVQRCFEMDTAKNCVDSYFCHNVENLQNCMFCFNIKNKRYAIANVEVGREKFMQLKQQLLSKITDELEAKGRLDIDIYSVLCAKGKKAK